MNLVISGVITKTLRNLIDHLVNAKRAIQLSERAIRFEQVESHFSTQESVARICSVAQVDHAFIDRDPGFESFGLLAMDMDSTLITIECIDEIAAFAGRRNEVAAITEATMRGEITSFAESLRKRAALLQGVGVEVLASVFNERLTLTKGAEELLAAAHQAGLHTMLVSGGFTYFTDRLVQKLGLNAGYGNRLEVIEGKLTGNVLEPILGSREKANVVCSTLQDLGLSRSSAIVIGDGANDIAMMDAVDYSVAYHAKPQVKLAARFRVQHGTLATVVDYFG